MDISSLLMQNMTSPRIEDKVRNRQEGFQDLIDECPSKSVVKKYYKRWLKDLNDEILQKEMDEIF